MELRHIKYFVAAANERNITRASYKLNISQPAISRLIRELECELGTTLFMRHRSGLDLTPAGKVFFQHSQRILIECEEAVKAVKEAGPVRSKLSVGFITTALESFLGEALSDFIHEHPETELMIHEMSPGDQIVALRNNQIDVAFIGNPCGKLLGGLRTLIIKEMRLEAALPARHRLHERTAIGLRELEPEKFIGYDEEKFPGRNQSIEKACSQTGFQPTFTGKARSLVEVLGMIGTGAGVCLMPSDVKSLPHPNVVFLPIDDEVEPILLAAVWLPDNKNSALGSMLRHLKG